MQDYYHCGFKCEKFCGAGVQLGQPPLNCTVRGLGAAARTMRIPRAVALLLQGRLSPASGYTDASWTLQHVYARVC